MKVFNIKHDDQAIHLETSHTKFGSLGKIMKVSAYEFIEKGKIDELRRVLATIEARMI